MKILLAVSGASGIVYARRLLEVLRAHKGVELSVIITKGARGVAEYERQELPTKIPGIPVYSEDDVAAPPASGSFGLDVMIVCPCSAKTLSALASGLAGNLVVRASEVQLKERRKLIIVPRETPVSAIQLENMLRLSRAGAVILPASPAFYPQPKTKEDMVDFVVGKILDSAGIKHNLFKRWTGGKARITDG